MNFIPDTVLNEAIPIYEHGFLPEQVEEIANKFKEIQKRDLFEIPTTREELKNIIIPMIRINRTKAFILKDEKKKPEKSQRVPKPKKLTKKQIKEKISVINLKKAMGEELTEEETTFFNELLQQEL